jgi:hypothetical protein
MKLHCIFFFFLTAAFFYSENIFAQLSETDSGFYHAAITKTVNLYHAATGDQSGLYNGAL